MKRWFTDTLAKRLFVLMWVALVVSHLLAFGAVRLLLAPPDGKHGAGPRMPPVLPSLPLGVGPEARPGPPEPPGRLGRPSREPAGLPLDALLLDYGVRLVVIALAAWAGSQWLSRPMRKLVGASRELAQTLPGSTAPPRLDEHSGTQEVREAAQVFNRMAKQLKEQFDARGLMVAAISHDLRTPLTRIRMRLETGAIDTALRERCAADVREMNGLIDSVLEVFRASHAEQALQPTDVGALVQSVVDDLVEMGADIAFDGVGAIAPAEPTALKRVVGNLLSNALRYGERAAVAVHADEAEVRITLDDHGPGIAPELLETVFQPFFRVDVSRSRDTGGTGLGLYIARELIQRQGGRLTLANRPEGGLRATITLPRRPLAGARDGGPATMR